MTRTVSKAVEQVVRAVIAKDKKGWTIIPGTISVDGDTATVEIASYPIRNVVTISLKEKKIKWSQA